MHLPRLTALLTYLIALASASPIAWPDDKLEEINALRAKGVSEVSRLSQVLSDGLSSIYMLSCLRPLPRLFERFQTAFPHSNTQTGRNSSPQPTTAYIPFASSALKASLILRTLHHGDC